MYVCIYVCMLKLIIMAKDYSLIIIFLLIIFPDLLYFSGDIIYSYICTALDI